MRAHPFFVSRNQCNTLAQGIEMTQKTVLNEVHRKAGARMVDFGGWDMPVNYGSQIEEHHACAGDCGMFDVSHMCAVDVVGPTQRSSCAASSPTTSTSCTVAGKALYSAMLNEAGGVVDDLIIYYLNDNHLAHRHQRRYGDQGSGLDGSPPSGLSGMNSHHFRAQGWQQRAGHDRRAGPERQGQGLGSAAAGEGCQRRPEALSSAFRSTTISSPPPATPAKTGFEIALPAADAESLCGTSWPRPVSPPAASAPAIRCASKPA
jgi:hypothetical protein